MIVGHPAHVAASRRSGNTAEVVSTERVLTAALHHLHGVRIGSYHYGNAAVSHAPDTN
jgi:hypothetical protein